MKKEPMEFNPSWLAKLLGQTPYSYRAIILDLSEVKIVKSTDIEEISYADILEISVAKHWWWQLNLSLPSEKIISLGGLNQRKVKAIQNLIPNYKAHFNEAIRKINDNSNYIVDFSEWIEEIKEGQAWVSKYDLEQMLEKLTKLDAVLELSNKYFRNFPDLMSSLSVIREFSKDPEKIREEANQKFIPFELQAYRDYFDQVEKYPLTAAQREAIVTHENNIRVIAGAGSGKTSVIVAKAGYLLKKRFYSASQILLLAFNRAAADEMKERIGNTLDVRITANTFHALGLKIISEVEREKPALAKVSEDENKLKDLIREIILELLYDPKTTKLISNFFQSFFAPYHSEFDFDNLGDYYKYLKGHGLLTLNGEYLKSFEEVEIANFLCLHGVEYEYEMDYPINTASISYRQYKPDFYLPKYNIYIEHFGIQRNQSVASHVNQTQYLDGMKWKRSIHQQFNTDLIETYSYQKTEGTLIVNLESELIAHGVKLQLIDPESILNKLNSTNQFDPLTNLMATFLNHFKGGCYTIDRVRDQAKERGVVSKRFEAFLTIFEKVLAKYEGYLAKDGTIDFNDMINLAAEYVEEGKYLSPYRCILVDEFQDISTSRARLIRALRNQDPNHRLFCVGDDWQAIYRFAGSDIAIMREFSEEFGYSETLTLDRTFRFNNRIEEVATSFILKNPAQIKKKIKAHTQVEESRIIVHHPERNTEDIFIEVLREIQRRDNGANSRPSILLLGRYNFLRDGLSWSKANFEFPNFDIDYKTVHSAKGLEADYVIVMGMNEGRYGFPSEIVDDPILNAVLSKSEDYPHAEERRLFYVALTRARHAVHLVVDRSSPSSFISEIKNYHGLVELVGAAGVQTIDCPSCQTGKLVQRTSRYGVFYGCSYYPLCDYRVDACKKCGYGLLVYNHLRGYFRCNNQNCNHIERPCPRCKTGRLVERKGKYGSFMGCTNFHSQDCKYTEQF
jgi:DNA helicase IV